MRWSRWWVLGIALSGVCLTGCADTETCTLAGCSHEASVTYSSGLVMGPYDLRLEPEGEDPLVARCSDPGAPEAVDNPYGLSCHSTGFLLQRAAAAAPTMRITITYPESGSVVVDAVEVQLETVEELRPNGPDCGPVCLVREGTLAATSD